MEHKDKISFLKALSALVKKTDIESELLSKLEEKIQDKNHNEKEKIILDLIEGLENNELLINIARLKNFEVNKVIENINKRIINNINELKKIKREHIILIKILLKEKILNTESSKIYIQSFTNLLLNLNNSGEIRNFLENITRKGYKNPVQELIFTEENFAYLLFLHFINLYLSMDEGDFSNYINKNKENLKIMFALYIKVSEKKPETNHLLVPLSVSIVFTDLYIESINLPHLGNIYIGKIFNIKDGNINFKSILNKCLSVLKELNILPDFLQKMDFLNKEYAVKILKAILKNDLYSERTLIDFCILFSSKIPDEYKKVINQKNKENKDWYKDFVLENLSNDNDILHNETLKFLQIIENWDENQEIKKKVEEFIKNKIDKIFEDEKIYEIFRYIIEKNESFNLNYTTKDIGKLLIENFIKIDTEDEKISFIFSHIDKLFSKKEIDLFASKLFEKIIYILEKINNFQYEILKQNKSLLKIEEKQIKEFFNKLIDIRINEIPFFIFKLIIKNNKSYLSENLKEDFRNKLVEIKENVELEGIIKIIDEILDLI